MAYHIGYRNDGTYGASLVAEMVKNLPAMQKEDKGSIVGLGKSPG